MELVTVSLVGLLVFQQVFFMRQVQKMIDKIMSKNFVEYKQMEAPAPSMMRQPQEQDDRDYRLLQDLVP